MQSRLTPSQQYAKREVAQKLCDPSKTPSVWSQLHSYQKTCVELIERVKTVSLYAEQGTGKTWMALSFIQRNCLTEMDIALIVVPLANLETTWAKTIRAQLPGFAVVRTIAELKGEVALGIVRPRPVIFLIHFDAIPKHIDQLKKIKWKCIFIDEAQRLRNRNGVQSRSIAKLRASAPYRVAMTGTPQDKDPQEQYGIFKFVRPELFGKWKDFEAKYLEPIEFTLEGLKPRSLKWQLMLRKMKMAKRQQKFNMEMLPDFLDTIQPYTLRIEKADVLDLPPLTFERVYVKMRGKQRQEYDSMLHKFMSDRIDLTAPLKATQKIKLSQITGGYVIDDNGETYELGRTKMREIARLNKVLGHDPVAIFATYSAEIAGIFRECHKQGFITSVIDGNVEKATRVRIIDAFQAGKIDRVIVQVKTGGVGIDLFRACTGIVYSCRHSHIDFSQMVARLHRIGQTRPVKFFLLTALDSVDEEVASDLISKSRVEKRVLQPLKRRRTR